VADCYEHGNESSCSIRSVCVCAIFDELRYYQIVKLDSVPLSYVESAIEYQINSFFLI
jgi:hypothetical protein